MSTVMERFEAKYIPVPESGCWLWIGAWSGNGYGNFSPESYRYALAHRASWELHVGPIPEGMNVLHRCDTPACVNPNHLFLGTQRDNIRDCVAKGRKIASHLAGEDHHRAKLTNDQAQCVYDDKRTARLIAADYAISMSLVSHIKTGYSYPSVTRGG